MRRRKSRGFTIVEVVVAAFLVALALTGMMSVLATVTRTDGRLHDKDRVERAADTKLNELIATGEITVDGQGEFEDAESADLSWSSTYQDTGTENLAHASVTVTKGDLEATAERLLFIRPEPEEEEEDEGAAPEGGAE